MSVVLVRVGHLDDRYEFVVERDGHAMTCAFRTEQSSLTDPGGVPLSVVVRERGLVAEFKETPDTLRPLNSRPLRGDRVDRGHRRQPDVVDERPGQGEQQHR
ncbi:hypothetical protein AB0442_40835, partial [Kitasatospora sp. NPDC085895]|uniref:hypothetical protein n=1 Tax=Kitasatospora sp. NPDC085895 TaxID=3155057 RepID=UPI00344CE8EA